MINATPSDFQLYNQHYKNLLTHLSRRMEAAQQRNDGRLLAMLEQEQRQLQAEWSASAMPASTRPLHKLRASWQRLMTALENSSKLQVESFQGAEGAMCWYAYDPSSGKMLYTESESDVVKWIEDNRLGR
jgi:uncharacterized protein YukE